MMLAAEAVGSDAGLRLVSPQSRDYWTPQDRVRVYVPPQASQGEPIRLELDGVDMDGRVRRQGRYLVLEPPHALDTGEHRLRAVATGSDEGPVEHGEWVFEVRAVAMPGGADESDESEPGRPRLASPDGQLPRLYEEASAGSGDSLLETHDLVLGPTGGAEGTVVSGRGPGSTGTLTGFSRDRLGGAAWSLEPVSQLDRSLRVSAAYVTGFGHEPPSPGASGLPRRQRHDAAWSVSLDSRWLHRRLRLRGEYADSNVQTDTDPASGDRDDSAANLRLSYAPASDLWLAGNALDWQVDLRYRRVGADFRAPSGSSPAPDRERTQLSNELQWGNLAMGLQLAREADNVDEEASRTRTHRDLARLDATYRPAPERMDGLPGLARAALRNPSIDLRLSNEIEQTDWLPATFLGPAVDVRARVIGVQSSFEPGSWSWGVGHSVSRIDDDSGVVGDSRTATTHVNATVPIAGRVSVSPRVQWSRIDSQAWESGATGWTLGLNTRADLVPGRLTGRLDLSAGTARRPSDTAAVRSRALGVDLSWQAMRARGRRPGLALDLESRYEQRRRPAAFARDYRAYLNARLGWGASP